MWNILNTNSKHLTEACEERKEWDSNKFKKSYSKKDRDVNFVLYSCYLY